MHSAHKRLYSSVMDNDTEIAICVIMNTLNVSKL